MRRHYQGTVEKGRGLAVEAMQNQKVVGVMARMTDLKIVPGTLNVRLDSKFDGPLNRYITMEQLGGQLPGVTNRKGLRLGPALIARRFHGFVFQGDEPNYPLDLVEMVSDHHLRKELGLRDGDKIEFGLEEE